MSADGWVYWQGSVSLLRGQGYRLFFHDTPIKQWPPLFSLYLAAFQAVLGVSGRSLAIAVSAAAGLAGLSWAALAAALARENEGSGKAISARLLPLLVFLAAFIGSLFRLLLADTLALALLPPALMASIILAREPSPRFRVLWLRSLPVCFWLLLCLVCKNSALAWVIGAGVLVLLLRGNRDSFGTAALCSGLVVVLPALAWLFLGALFGQSGSHEIGIHIARFSGAEYAWQAFDSIAGMLGPARFLHLGAILTAAIFTATLAASRSRNASDGAIREATGGLLVFLIVSLIATGLLLALTGVEDGLAGRFVWFAPLILVSAAALAWARIPISRALDRALGGVLLVVVGLSVFYAARSSRPAPAATAPESAVGSFIHNNWTIEPGFVESPPERRGNRLLISPPVFRWERRIRGAPPP